VKGVRARLILWNIAVIGLILAAMGLALRTELHANLISGIDQELRRDAADVEIGHASPAWLPKLPPGGQVTARASMPGEGEALAGGRTDDLTMFERMGGALDTITLHAEAQMPKLIPVGGSTPVGPAEPYDLPGYRIAATGAATFRDFTSRGERSRSYSVPVISGGRVAAVAQSVRNLAPVLAVMHRVDIALAAILPLALLAAAGAGTLLVVGAMRPLRMLTDAARTLEPDRRLPVVGKDEFADLATAFNEAFDKTALAFGRQKRALRQLERFTGDAGHELRTPLAVVKGSVTQLLDRPRVGADARKSLEIIDRASDRMARLIDDLLLLARQDAIQASPRRDPVDVGVAIERALGTRPHSDTVIVESDIEPALAIMGDGEALERAIANLLANALTYARTRLRVSGKRVGEIIEIRIEDDGEGILPEHLPRLGERFYRPETSRSRERGGVGLGLAIAKGIVEAHGGRLDIASTVGVGTTVTLRIPVEVA